MAKLPRLVATLHARDTRPLSTVEDYARKIREARPDFIPTGKRGTGSPDMPPHAGTNLVLGLAGSTTAVGAPAAVAVLRDCKLHREGVPDFLWPILREVFGSEPIYKLGTLIDAILVRIGSAVVEKRRPKQRSMMVRRILVREPTDFGCEVDCYLQIEGADNFMLKYASPPPATQRMSTEQKIKFLQSIPGKGIWRTTEVYGSVIEDIARVLAGGPSYHEMLQEVRDGE